MKVAINKPLILEGIIDDIKNIPQNLKHAGACFGPGGSRSPECTMNHQPRSLNHNSYNGHPDHLPTDGEGHTATYDQLMNAAKHY